MNRILISLLSAVVLVVFSLTGCSSNKPATKETPPPSKGAIAGPVGSAQAVDWDKVKALPAPFSKKDPGMVKLAWREDGLHGYVEIRDAKIEPATDSPWEGDCVELWLETDAARSDFMTDACTQIVFAPDPAAGPGKAKIVVPQGAMNETLVAARWKPVPNGYSIQFHIPSKELKPAMMRAGTKMGFQYAVNDGGTAIEQFACDKNAEENWQRPVSWGMIELTEGGSIAVAKTAK